jgi:peptide/nickel transport system permease protein
MAVLAKPSQADVVSTQSANRARSASAAGRIARFTIVRAISLLITVTLGVYLTILIANMGGYVDEIQRGLIADNITLAASLNPQYRLMDEQQRADWVNGQIAIQEKRLGLDQPFMIRSFRYLGNAMILDLGMAENMSADSGSKQVRLILLERLPSTLVLFASSQLFLFFFTLFFALALSRAYGSWVDKLVIALTPTSTIPSWFYGIFLIVYFAAIKNILPYGGMVDTEALDGNVLHYALSVIKHMVLPVVSIMLSTLALGIYGWRTLFLIYSSEDYVELAKAKGLSDRQIESRYILRPSLPNIITTFALTVIGLWQGAIILETVFNWPGLGRTLFQASNLFENPVIVASTVIFAYLLAMTVFLLDIIYVLVDPRVQVGGEGSKA